MVVDFYECACWDLEYCLGLIDVIVFFVCVFS